MSDYQKGWEKLAANIESNMPQRIVEQLRDSDTYTEKLSDRYLFYRRGKFSYPQPPQEGVKPQMVIFMFRRWRRKRNDCI